MLTFLLDAASNPGDDQAAERTKYLETIKRHAALATSLIRTSEVQKRVSLPTHAQDGTAYEDLLHRRDTNAGEYPPSMETQNLSRQVM